MESVLNAIAKGFKFRKRVLVHNDKKCGLCGRRNTCSSWATLVHGTAISVPGWDTPASMRRVESAFCECLKDPRNCGVVGTKLTCSCGEEYDVHEWKWNVSFASSSIRFSEHGREVQFHPVYSSGTAVIRGEMPFVQGNHYYWEIKILTTLYGTDVMIGVGTAKVNLNEHHYDFCSLLGKDDESWGYSYKGVIQHDGNKRGYGKPYGHGSIVGVHLDTWSGTLEFFLNRKSLGIAFSNLHGKTLYPMVTSTAAKSVMRLTYSTSTASSLQLLCLQKIYTSHELVKKLRTVPLLRSLVDNEYWWMFQSKPVDKPRDETDDDIFNDSSELDVNLIMCMNMINDEEKKSKSVLDEDKEKKITAKKRRIATEGAPSTSTSQSNSGEECTNRYRMKLRSSKSKR